MPLAARRESIRRAGRGRRRISPWRCSGSNANSGPKPIARHISSRCFRSPGPMAMSIPSRVRSMAASSGRPGATRGSAMIPCSCPMAAARPLVRWIPRANIRSAIAPRPSAGWSQPVLPPSHEPRLSLPLRPSGENWAALVTLSPDDGGFGIYLHWPFCKSKCPYCDFNSHVREKVDQARWRQALLAELDHYAQSTAGRRLDSVFFGGGTPSLMPPETVAALIERIGQHWAVSGDLEITLEANPTSVEAANFADLAEAGVNRVSLGVQALDDAALKFLGRGHSASEALAALDIARRHFGRFSFDLIYSRPGQTLQSWSTELSRA